MCAYFLSNIRDIHTTNVHTLNQKLVEHGVQLTLNQILKCLMTVCIGVPVEVCAHSQVRKMVSNYIIGIYLH